MRFEGGSYVACCQLHVDLDAEKGGGGSLLFFSPKKQTKRLSSNKNTTGKKKHKLETHLP